MKKCISEIKSKKGEVKIKKYTFLLFNIANIYKIKKSNPKWSSLPKSNPILEKKKGDTPNNKRYFIVWVSFCLRIIIEYVIAIKNTNKLEIIFIIKSKLIEDNFTIDPIKPLFMKPKSK